jgi:ABC-type multidrug transport system fused ATPase/permease subunit
MFKMMRQQPQIDSTSKEGQRPQIEGEINLEQVEFSYPRAPNHLVLRGLSLRAERAKTLALVGEFKCVMRFVCCDFLFEIGWNF